MFGPNWTPVAPDSILSGVEEAPRQVTPQTLERDSGALFRRGQHR